MDIIKYAQCGSLESCDLLVQIKPHDKGIVLELNSNVYREFGDKIKKLALNELKKFGVKNAYVNIQDQGALEFTISSRLETAIKRASKEGEVC